MKKVSNLILNTLVSEFEGTHTLFLTEHDEDSILKIKVKDVFGNEKNISFFRNFIKIQKIDPKFLAVKDYCSRDDYASELIDSFIKSDEKKIYIDFLIRRSGLVVKNLKNELVYTQKVDDFNDLIFQISQIIPKYKVEAFLLTKGIDIEKYSVNFEI